MAASRQSMETAAVYLLLLGLPLAQSPTESDPFLPVRLIVLGVGLGLGLWAPASGRLPRSIVSGLAVAAVVFAIASLAGATPLLSLLGRYPRYEGLPMVLGYALALVVGARLLAPDAARLRAHAVNALVLASITNASVALIQWATSPEARVTGLLGNSTTLANVSLVALAVLVCQLSGWSWWRLAGAASACACLVLSASRGAVLGGMVAALAVLVLRPLVARRGRWWWGPMAAAGLLGAAWLAPGSRARLAGQTPFAESTVDGRLLLWQDSWRLIVDRPLVGVGPSRFVDSIGGYHTEIWAAQVGPYAPPDSPHNLVLQVLAGTGWLGLAAVVGLGVCVARRLWLARPWDRWLLGAGVASIALIASYLTSFTDPVSLTMLSVVLGGGIATPAARGRPVWLDVSRRLSAVVVVLVMSFLGGTATVAEVRYSQAIAAGGDPAGLMTVADIRPWDADLARRVGYTAARLAERGVVDPAGFVPRMQSTCERLPGSVECLQVVADLQDMSGRHGNALATLARALEWDPTNLDTVLRQGIAHAGMGQYDQAIAAFERAVALRPTAPEPWENLARVYDLDGRHPDAATARARAEELRRR
ncbi:MAG: O-antigen ligase family protein [Micropruina sp.]|uniref:O-antigen ligase family protein n=1 Tax=Micropruina sp. TaxID=2737536 RepID=UPI0039E6B746